MSLPRQPPGSASGPFTCENLPALLGRSLRCIPIEAGVGEVRGGRVLITGAGGSVGRALVQRLSALPLERLVAVELHEAALFHLTRDLQGITALEPRLADVRNTPKVRRILDEVRPDAVFHLAAYKHVPIGEAEPDEMVSVNVLGTARLLAACIDAGVTHLVYPSSDKAVDPPSLYGATKRLAETLLLASAAAQSTTATHVVRYVNIIGSSGSVLETLAAEVARGNPLPLTDPRMTRYWMSMDEATDLLLHALALPSGTRTLLDTGPPIPVETIARRLHALIAGPGASAEFVITGARPGERLAEQLISVSERLEAVAEDPVLRIVGTPVWPARDAPPLTDGTGPGPKAHEEAALDFARLIQKELQALMDDGRIHELRERAMALARLAQ